MSVNVDALTRNLVDYAEELLSEHREVAASMCVELALFIMKDEAHSEDVYEKAIGLRSRLLGRATRGLFSKVKAALFG